MLLYLLSFGVAVVPLQKSKISITEKSSLIGGKENGKQLLNSHQKEQFSITMLATPAILKVELSLVNSLNGVKPLRRLITTQLAVI
jgi:hypothetical protein